jgi:hypothetical protein
LAHIRLNDPSRRREFEDLYYSWAKLDGSTIIAYPTFIDHVSGELSYHNVPLAFVEVLRAKGYPFSSV